MSEDITTKRIDEVRGTMSQDEFAKSIKSSQPVISKILSGDQQASINVLTEIAKTYEVSVDWLLGLSSRKSLKGYSTYNDVNPTTYADIIAFFVKLMKNNSIIFEKEQDNMGSYVYDPQTVSPSNEKIYIIDHFIGDVISSIYALVKINPESVDSVMTSMIENYDIPLLEWSAAIEMYYSSNINYRSTLEVLKEYINAHSEDNQTE